MKQELLYLACIDCLNIDKYNLIKNSNNTFEFIAFKANYNDLLLIGFKKQTAEKIINHRKKTDLNGYAEILKRINARLIFIEDEEYPKILKKIARPPIFLFAIGEKLNNFRNCISIVGTRKISSIGKEITKKITSDLVKNNICIVSGLAKGVDKIAHEITLSENGKTIAVLGNGIDKIYPSENLNLAKEIIKKGGSIISEFAPKAPPFHYNFPRRNRIVAGLSHGTVIIEGMEKSGSLITARLALEENREVFAIPGSPLNSMASGPNSLIQNGLAKLTTNADDILSELNMEQEEKISNKKIEFDNNNEKIIFDILENSIHFDEIVIKSNFSPSEVLSILSMLEIQDFVINNGSNYWSQNIN